MFQVYFKCVTRTNSTLFHMVEKHYNYYRFDLSSLTNRSSFFINSPLNFKNLKIKVAKLISGSKTVFCFVLFCFHLKKDKPTELYQQSKNDPFAGYQEMTEKASNENSNFKIILF